VAKQYDPKMHSAEHLLNQTMIRKFECGRCFSAHINKKKSKCDYHFDRNLTLEEIREVEAAVNEQILKNLSVRIEMVEKDLARQTLNLSKVPEADGLDMIRVVHMGNYDVCPCIGPHVETTSEIGRFNITTTGFDDGVLRIRFKLCDFRL
jgi:misacylated tRNA(Ala) deacylase